MKFSNVTREEMDALMAAAKVGNAPDSYPAKRTAIHHEQINCEYKGEVTKLTGCATCKRWKIQCKKENIPVTADHCYYFCKLSIVDKTTIKRG